MPSTVGRGRECSHSNEDRRVSRRIDAASLKIRTGRCKVVGVMAMFHQLSCDPCPCIVRPQGKCLTKIRCDPTYPCRAYTSERACRGRYGPPRTTYDKLKTNVGAGISHNQHPDHDQHPAGAAGCHAADGAGDYHAAHNERSRRITQRASSHVHRRLSAGLFESYPPPQCAGVCLRAGGLRRDAGARGKRTHAAARPDLL